MYAMSQVSEPVPLLLTLAPCVCALLFAQDTPLETMSVESVFVVRSTL